MKKEKEILVTEEDYLKQVNHINELRDLIKKERLERKETGVIYSTDNYDYQTAISRERLLVSMLLEAESILERFKVIKSLADDTVVNLGDVIEASFTSLEGNEEVSTFKLVSTSTMGSFGGAYAEISINSPAGAAIYGKKLGESATYKVLDNEFRITALSKISVNGQDLDKGISRVRTDENN